MIEDKSGCESVSDGVAGFTGQGPVVSASYVPNAQFRYVISQQSLQGVGGWLVLALVVFAFSGLSCIMVFSLLLAVGWYNAAIVLTLIFTPLLAVGYVASVVLIAMQKKLGKLVIIATFGVSALYFALLVVTSVESFDFQIAPVIGGVLSVLVFFGLFALYFTLSRRVKATLVE